MSKVIPTTYSVPGRLQYTARSTIDAADWQDLIEGAHYLFARAGARLGGEVFNTPLALPADGTVIDLDSRTPASVLTRYLESGVVKVQLKCFGAVAQVDVDVINAATGTTELSLSASTASATPEEFSATGTISFGKTLDGDSNPALLYVTGTAQRSVLETAGELSIYSVREHVITDTSLLPTGL